MNKVVKGLAPDNSNEEMEAHLKANFQDMIWQTLTYLEIAFPHEKGDGTANEKQYKAIRQKVLRIGNNNIRELDSIFDSYVVLKIYEYKKQVNPKIQTDIVTFKDAFKKGDGYVE